MSRSFFTTQIAMQIYLRTLEGTTRTIEVELTDTIEVVMSKARIQTGVQYMNLMSGGRALREGRTVEDYPWVRHEITLLVVRRWPPRT